MSSPPPARLGIRGLTGENLLVDLRDRLERTAEIPPLPCGWSAEFAIAAANGEGFAGDFLVTSLPIAPPIWRSRSSTSVGRGRRIPVPPPPGAFSGLLGSVPPETFLTRANDYPRCASGGDEGFATAVHLWLDLDTGRYAVSRAGHPPTAVFRSGTASWMLDSTVPGPLLGVFGGAEFPRPMASSRRAMASSCTRTGWWRVEGGTSSTDWTGCWGGASGILVAGRIGVADGVVAGARSGERRPGRLLHPTGLSATRVRSVMVRPARRPLASKPSVGRQVGRLVLCTLHPPCRHLLEDVLGIDVVVGRDAQHAVLVPSRRRSRSRVCC